MHGIDTIRRLNAMASGGGSDPAVPFGIDEMREMLAALSRDDAKTELKNEFDEWEHEKVKAPTDSIQHVKSLRDHFAAAALTGLITRYGGSMASVREAWEIADLMLQEREK